MFAEHLRFDRVRADLEALGDMHAKAQAVEKRAGAQHTIVARQRSRQIRERIRRIGDDKQHRFRCRLYDAGYDVLIYCGIGVEALEAAGGIVAIGGAAGLFIDADCDHDQRGASEVLIVSVIDIGERRQRRAVANIGRDCLRAAVRPIDQDDIARATAHDERERTGRSHRAGADYSDFHERLRIAADDLPRS